MARFSAGARAAGAGSTTLPSLSLYAVAASGCRIREIGVFNTTATAVDVVLKRLTTAGTQGSGLTEDPHDQNGPAAACTAFNTHTVGPTLGNDVGYRKPLGAAIGDGIIWTFGDSGLIIPKGTANGVGIIIAQGTGQVLDGYFVWDE